MSERPVVIHGSAAYPSGAARPVVTIGNFDGVHLGHRALLARSRALAGDGPVCAYTFHPSPRDVMAPGHGVPSIQSHADKLASLGDAGADQVVVEPFTPAFGEQPARWFCEEILGRRLRARAVVVGYDFRFGRGREGDAAVIRDVLGVPVETMGGIRVDGELVSSTEVRRRVGAGDVAGAARLLGRPHELVGTVVPGDARGRALGFPTANVVPDTELLPPPGVYAVRACVDGAWHDAVANLGSRPTFDGAGLRLEVHVLDVDVDLYGRTLRVALVDRLREERAFAGVDALVARIRDDVAEARRVLAEAPWR